MKFYVDFAIADPVMGGKLAVLTVADGPDAAALAEAIVRKRRGRDYGFIYTQEQFDSFPPEYGGSDLELVDFADVPETRKEAG